MHAHPEINNRPDLFYAYFLAIDIVRRQAVVQIDKKF